MSFKMVAGLLVAAGMATVVHAGVKGTQGVVVDSTNREAYGVMADARSDSSSLSRITIVVEVAPSFTFAAVVFTDATGNSAQCYTMNASQIQWLASLDNDAYIDVTWDTTGECTTITTENDSAFSPKEP